MIQVARTLFGLSYGTWETVYKCKGKCTIGATYRQNTNAVCSGRLIRSSDEVSVMEVEQRDGLIIFTIFQLAKGCAYICKLN